MSRARRRSWRRRFSIAFAIGTWICLVLAALSLPRPSSIEYVRRPISDATIAMSETGVSGILSDHLPPFRLQWDGQPPQAFLVNDRTNQVLAPSVLSNVTFRLNRNAVLWTPTGCSFVISHTLYSAHRDHLAITFEVPRPRRMFFLWTALSMILAACTVLLHFGSGVLFTTSGRIESLGAYVQALLFLLAAAVVALTQFPGYPVTANPGSDEPNINSFAAALDRPDVFRRDKLLSQRSNFDWYTPLYVRWVRLFHWFGLRYDTNRAFVIFFSTAIGLFGYQRLFGSLSGSSWFGCIAAICVWFLQAKYPPNETWSASLATPRTAFSAMLPWILLVAITYLDRPHRWWIPTSLSGLLFYVHPVSSPALTGGILTGLLAAGREPLRIRVRQTAIAGAAAVAVMIPYILVYASKYTRTIVPDAEVAKKVVQYATQRYAPGYLDWSVFSAQLAVFFTQNRRLWLGAAAIVLVIPMARRSPRVRFFYGALSGLCAVTFMIPFLDLTLAQRWGTLPFQVDLIRNIRYTDVIVVSFVALAVGEYRRLWGMRAGEQLHGTGGARLAGARRLWMGGVVLSAMVAILYAYRPLLLPTVRSTNALSRASLYALRGQLSRSALSTIEVINAVHALRRDGESVYGPYAFRQMFIPMTFCHKDLGALSYANPHGLIEARETLDQTARYMRPPITLVGATEAARRMDAQILVLRSAALDPALLASTAVIFRNRDVAVLRITDSGAAEGQVQQWPPRDDAHGG